MRMTYIKVAIPASTRMLEDVLESIVLCRHQKYMEMGITSRDLWVIRNSFLVYGTQCLYYHNRDAKWLSIKQIS